VLARVHDLDENIEEAATRRQLWEMAGDIVPVERPGEFNQALMELGQQICLQHRPLCNDCPLGSTCLARQRGTQLERPVRPPRKRTPHYDVVAAVIWRDDHPSASGRFLIAQRLPDGLLGGLWEFPGGKVEPGESLQDALRREIYEELALDISPSDSLTEVDHAYTHFRITIHAFHAAIIQGKVKHLGVANHAWVTLDDVDRYAFAVTNRKIIAHLREELSGEIDASASRAD
jgi:A/G-specific adenine glycosylase